MQYIMASTRNRNTPGDYRLEKGAYQKTCDYNTYETYGVPTKSYYPGLGIAGAKMARTELAQNSCDIESNLFGIGANNLENPTSNGPSASGLFAPTANGDLKTLDMADRVPFFMPKPLEVDTKIQRPLYLS